MIFMLAATLTQLVLTIIKQIQLISKGGFTAADPAWGHYFQCCFAAAMAILAVILVIEGVRTFASQVSKKNPQFEKA